jgi:hypothetical protein
MVTRKPESNPEAIETPAIEEIVSRSDAFQDAYDTAAFVLEAASLVRRMRERAIRDDGGTGYSQKELAARLPGLSQPRLSVIERGTGRDGISYSVLKRIARACHIEWPALHPLLDQQVTEDKFVLVNRPTAEEVVAKASSVADQTGMAVSEN